MSEAKDPALKLFGRSISLPEKDACGVMTKAQVDDPMPSSSDGQEKSEQDSSMCSEKNSEYEHQPSNNSDKELTICKVEQDKIKNNGSDQAKALKKPDKVLPCPRCNSMDTKFCYYNNYNVNQPRYFCKKCQRYWTAGGTMRNVPVGAGRRKNKNSVSHYRQCSQTDVSNSAHPESLSGGLSLPFMKYSQEGPLCESMASVLNLSEKRSEDMGSLSCRETTEEPSTSSSMTAMNCNETEVEESIGCIDNNDPKSCYNGVTPMQCFPGTPWAYTWAAMATNRCPPVLACRPENGNPNPTLPWRPPPMIIAPAFCPPTIPFPLVPPTIWNVPWPRSIGSVSSLPSPILGKHSRDTSMQSEEKNEKSLWVPKTLRIDDPGVAAKSSIWAALGIRPEEEMTKGGIFKGFQSRTENSKGETPEAAQALQANPAALSRYRAFQEST
ncbi:hypothetical protein J5N97_017525 [Dioscorea zingiberensis]|uniref:Dof-type domain-containing protein n=1 Tax=Dioscorea zingiberensis TaxID=325984 RepID=A0A9D5CLU2_9LILI|nr:hypothetical protein J5N97_017525 [Dioscorea zingiberensis]